MEVNKPGNIPQVLGWAVGWVVEQGEGWVALLIAERTAEQTELADLIAVLSLTAQAAEILLTDSSAVLNEMVVELPQTVQGIVQELSLLPAVLVAVTVVTILTEVMIGP